MERNAPYFLVGLFMFVIIAAGTLMFIWLAGSYDTRKYDRYAIYFEDSITGLSEGSPVSYRGVNIGRVLKIRFDPEAPERIRVVVEVDENTPISTSSSVSLQALGITGLAALAIKTDDSLGTDLPIPEGEKYPVIPFERSGIGKILGDAPQITSNIIEVLNRVNILLSDENTQNVQSILQNLNDTTAQIDLILNEENVQDISQTLKDISAAGKRLNSIMTQLDQSAVRINKTLAKNEKSIERFTGENLDEASMLIREAREAVQSFKVLAERLGDDPSQIIYKPNYSGVEIKQ